MLLQTILDKGISAADQLGASERTTRAGRNNAGSLPASGGSDVVSISPEARAALAGATPGEAEQADRTSGTREAFTNYMDKARNRAQEEESGDKLEQLRKKLKELRNRLAQVMTGKQTGDKNEGQVKAQNSQNREVATQIAELTAQAKPTKGK